MASWFAVRTLLGSRWPLFVVIVLISISGLSIARRPRPKTFSYYRDVAPILGRRCVRCHSDEGLAARPRLDTYDEVSKYVGAIALSVQTRMMPPWGADGTGLCRTWRDSLWLSDPEIATLVHWQEQSMPRGDPAERVAAEVDSPRSGVAKGEPQPELDHIDAVLDTGADVTAGLGPSAYRCFVADPSLSRDRLLTGIRVISTDPRMVAQVTIYAPDSAAAEADALRLDNEDSAPGYSCYGSARVSPARLIASWTWDSPALPFPPGTGLRLEASRKLVVQVHYNVITSGLGAKTHTRIEMSLDDGVREASFISLSAQGLSLAPGRTYAEAAGELTAEGPMTVLAVAPQMHTLGRTMQVDHQRGATRSCAASFDHWDFYRQRLFVYDEPLRVEAGDRLRVSCVYNTQSATQPVQDGETIHDEACTANLYVVAPGR